MNQIQLANQFRDQAKQISDWLKENRQITNDRRRRLIRLECDLRMLAAELSQKVWWTDGK